MGAIAIRLTPTGEQQAVAGWSEALQGAVGQLSPQEQAVFVEGLIKIIGSLQAQGKISLVRMCTTCQHFRPHAHADPQRPHHCAFLDAPIGGGQLQIDCPDHLAA